MIFWAKSPWPTRERTLLPLPIGSGLAKWLGRARPSATSPPSSRLPTLPSRDLLSLSRPPVRRPKSGGGQLSRAKSGNVWGEIRWHPLYPSRVPLPRHWNSGFPLIDWPICGLEKVVDSECPDMCLTLAPKDQWLTCTYPNTTLHHIHTRLIKWSLSLLQHQ